MTSQQGQVRLHRSAGRIQPGQIRFVTSARTVQSWQFSLTGQLRQVSLDRPAEPVSLYGKDRASQQGQVSLNISAWSGHIASLLLSVFVFQNLLFQYFLRSLIQNESL
jgi:hypothetical protein